MFEECLAVKTATTETKSANAGYRDVSIFATWGGK
jgi:hypothetical protein